MHKKDNMLPTTLLSCLLLVASFIAGVSPASASEYLIHAGRLIDGVADKPRENVSVLVSGKKIVSVQSGFAAPAEQQEVVDLKDATLMPGLMDMHSHIEVILTPQSYIEKFSLDEANHAIRSTVYAENILMAGFTTIRNLGGRVSLNLRDEINSGRVPGPRILSLIHI